MWTLAGLNIKESVASRTFAKPTRRLAIATTKDICECVQTASLTTSIEYNAFMIVNSKIFPHISCSPGLWGDMGMG